MAENIKTYNTVMTILLVIVVIGFVVWLIVKRDKNKKYTNQYNITWRSPNFGLNTRVKLLPNVRGLTAQDRFDNVNTVGTVVEGETIVSSKVAEEEMKTRTPVQFISGDTFFINPNSLEHV